MNKPTWSTHFPRGRGPTSSRIRACQRAARERNWYASGSIRPHSRFPATECWATRHGHQASAPGFANFDVSLLKDFHFTETRFLQFRTHLYNLFNRANFSNPNGSRGNPAFGQISSVRNDGRFIQLSLRFIF